MLTSVSNTVQDPHPRECTTHNGLGLSTPIKLNMTIPHRHAQRPTQCRQFLTVTLSPGYFRLCCQLEKTTESIRAFILSCSCPNSYAEALVHSVMVSTGRFGKITRSWRWPPVNGLSDFTGWGSDTVPFFSKWGHKEEMAICELIVPSPGTKSLVTRAQPSKPSNLWEINVFI